MQMHPLIQEFHSLPGRQQNQKVLTFSIASGYSHRNGSDGIRNTPTACDQAASKGIRLARNKHQAVNIRRIMEEFPDGQCNSVPHATTANGLPTQSSTP